MSTLKEAPTPKISPYLQFLYGLFNFLILGLMIVSFVSVGNYAKSSAVQGSNANKSPEFLHPEPLKETVRNTDYLDPVYSSVEDGNSIKAPSCSMDSCFNFSRCDNAEELLIFHYSTPESQAWYFKDALERSPYYTTDPEKACLFFVTVDMRTEKVALDTLPYWNHGLNHIIISISDFWVQRKSTPVEAIEMASTMTSITHHTSYRTGFDISVPLPQKKLYSDVQGPKAFERKYFLTFIGMQFLGGLGSRINPVLRSMHNGEDVIIAITCKQDLNSEALLSRPELRAKCVQDQSVYEQYTTKELMDSTFGLVQAGRGSSSSRLLEVLSAGSIPVVISDNFVLPFDSLLDWRRCVLVFPSSQTQRIVRTLRSLSEQEVEFRREYCLFIYRDFLADDDKIVDTTAMALKARFFGVLPKLNPKVPLRPRRMTSEHDFLDSL